MLKAKEKILSMISDGWSLFEEWPAIGKSFFVKRGNDGIKIMVVCKNGSVRKPNKREMEEVGDGKFRFAIGL